MEFVDIANRYSKQDLGTQVMTESQSQNLATFIPSSMDRAILQATSKAQAEDWIMATMGAFATLEDAHEDDETMEGRKKKSVWQKILHWLGRKIEHRMEKAVFSFIRKMMFRTIRWIVEEAIGPIFRFAIRSLVTPVLEVIGAVIASPELLIAAGIGAVAVGLGFLGKWLFDKYFMSGHEPSGGRLAFQATEGQASPPMPYGEATVPSSMISVPPMQRSGIGQKQYTQLESLLQRGESGRRGYDAYNFSSIGNVHHYAGKPVSEMTIQEVRQQQQLHNYNAVGRYQMIATTLDSAIKFLRLDPSAKFDQAMQDYIFEAYLITRKQKAIGDYISGKTDDLWGAVFAASQEWASVAAPPGYPLFQNRGRGDGITSYYSGIQGNRASISAIEMAQTLQSERQNYSAANDTSRSRVAEGVAVQPKQQQPSQQNQETPQVSSTSGTGRTTQSIIRHNGVLLAVNG